MTHMSPSSPSALLLLNTPKRLSLTAQFNILRTDLKVWEKDFATAHDGRKADRADIKRHPEIARKYKEYNRIRDVLAWKATAVSIAGSSSPSAQIRRDSPSKTRKHERSQRHRQPTRTEAETSRKRKQPSDSQNLNLHPSTLDPYDAPTSAHRQTPLKPYAFRQVIGPTPQRDGKALGLFDLLSTSGSSQATPSSRKRKADVLKEVHRNVVQTPSRKAARSGEGREGGDLLKHLDAEEDENDVDMTVGGRHSRTPASEGKKFLLSQFFATPTVGRGRFTTIIGERDTVEKGGGERDGYFVPEKQQTPLRNSVLKDRKNVVFTPEHDDKKLPLLLPSRVVAAAGTGTVTGTAAADATPPFLQRQRPSSFNQRLLSASAFAPTSQLPIPAPSMSTSTSTAAAAASNLPLSLSFSSPSAVRRTNAPRSLRPPNGRSLSEIVWSLRKLDDEKFGDGDDLEAMRDAETAITGVLAKDSQSNPAVQETSLGDEGDVDARRREEVGKERVWKKKGQKRTTRRVKMKPSVARPREEPRWVDGDGDGGSDDDEDQEEDKGKGADGESEDELTRIEETQLQSTGNALPLPLSPESSGDELGDNDEYVAVNPPKKKPRKGSSTSTLAKTTLGSVKGRTAAAETKAKDKETGKKPTKPAKPRTYNPNATSHQNFRSLKIKNRNSKAKGGGGGRGGGGRRFGGRRR